MYNSDKKKMFEAWTKNCCYNLLILLYWQQFSNKPSKCSWSKCHKTL